MKFRCPECGFVMEGEDGKPPRCHRHSLHFSIYKGEFNANGVLENGHEMKPVELLECPECMEKSGEPSGFLDHHICSACKHEWRAADLMS